MEIFLHIQVIGVIADCIDKQTVQLKIGNELHRFELASVLRLNDSTIQPLFIPAKQDCTIIEVSLVDGNGKVNDIHEIDCGKLLAPA